MNTVLKDFLCVAMSVGLLATTGCEECTVDVKDGDNEETRTGYCSVEKWTATRPPATREVALDGTLRIDNANGSVKVQEWNGNDVEARFEVFVFRAFNTPDSEIQDNFRQLKTVLDASDENPPRELVIDIRRENGAPGSLGADVTVKVPRGFTGRLLINPDNGSTDIDSAADASEVRVSSDNGSIEANIGAAETVSLRTDNGRITVDADQATNVTLESGNGSINATLPAAATANISTENGRIEAGLGVAGSLTMHTDNGNISASFASVAQDASGGSITTDSGNVVLGVPSSGDYAVPATASEAVSFGEAPSECNVQQAAENSKTLTCSDGGPEFTVHAEGGSVTVSYN